MDDAAVLEKYGIHAKQYPELAALVGETSDNLKGVPGVGPKTAAKWIQEYGSLQGILDAAESIPGKVGESLREHKDLAVRNRRLNHLLRDLEFEFGISDLELGAVNEDSVREVFAKLSFRTLLTRVLKLRGANGSQHKVISAKIESERPEQPLSSEPVPTKAAEVVASLPTSPVDPTTGSISDIKKLVEEGGAHLKIELSDGRVIGIGAASIALRLNWDGIGDPKALIEAGGFATWDFKMVSKNLKSAGIVLGPISDDPLLACYLIDPLSKDLNPDALIRTMAGIDIVRQDPNELLADSDPSLDAWIYAALTAVAVPHLESEGAIGVYRDIELAASVVLSQMEQTGIAVDSKN
jgi:DNA polymerase-1